MKSPDGQFSLEGSSLTWVTARPREGHAAACLRHGLDPTTPVVFLSDKARENTREKCGDNPDAATYSRVQGVQCPVPSVCGYLLRHAPEQHMYLV